MKKRFGLYPEKFVFELETEQKKSAIDKIAPPIEYIMLTLN